MHASGAPSISVDSHVRLRCAHRICRGKLDHKYLGIGNILDAPFEYQLYQLYINYMLYRSHFLLSKPNQIGFVGCLHLGHSIPEANFSK